jgi:hypothetical protein
MQDVKSKSLEDLIGLMDMQMLGGLRKKGAAPTPPMAAPADPAAAMPAPEAAPAAAPGASDDQDDLKKLMEMYGKDDESADMPTPVNSRY